LSIKKRKNLHFAGKVASKSQLRHIKRWEHRDNRMIQFPIDPTPFLIPYALIVFFLPWLVAAVFVLRGLKLLYQSGVMNELNKLSPFSFRERREIHRRYLKQNPEAAWVHKNAVRWGILTLAAWVVGFVLIGGTLYWMDQNDLLIDHSSGLYGPKEAPNNTSEGIRQPADRPPKPSMQNVGAMR
jgi:hypothetical protein